jgi:hypothetical protein
MKNVYACACMLAIGMAVSAGPACAADGKALYISKCGSCHKSGGTASVFAPTKYASVQWERFFEAGKHNRIKDISGMLAPDESSAVKEYLKSHAADSDQPEAIGLK